MSQFLKIWMQNKAKIWNSLVYWIFLVLKFLRKIVLNRCVLTMPMKSYSSILTSICSTWSRQSTQKKILSGNRYHLLIINSLLTLLKIQLNHHYLNCWMRNAWKKELEMIRIYLKTITICYKAISHLRDLISLIHHHSW